jgi:aminoglycoside phosphotransferase (APT) family kinase protein
MHTSRDICHYLRRSGRLGPGLPASEDHVSFLAAGEYNENHLVRAGGRTLVLRINHGSQLGLDAPGEQIRYEYRVLRALEASGVTPRPLFCDPDAPLGNGVLAMEYLPGCPLDYARDTALAARLFARVHARPVPPAGDGGLLVQARPVRDIADESIGLVERFPDHPLDKEGARLRAFHQEILRLDQDTATLFDAEGLVIVNTEVNSHNFLRDEHAGPGAEPLHLVDWEKAVVSHRYQDLGHFLVQTTTRWKTGHVFDEAAKQAFVREYLAAGDTGIAFDEAWEKTRVLERTILLRALSWCYMAWYEYTTQERALASDVTWDRIRTYLGEMECLLR